MMSIGDFRIVKCRKCGLVYVNPRLRENKLHEIYNKEYYSNPAFRGVKKQLYGYDRYLEDEFYIKETFKGRLRNIDRFSKKGSLLDVGCALGFFLEIAKEDGWKAKGLELSGHAYAYAKNKLGLDVLNKTIGNSNLKSSSFDAVTMFDVIEHLPDPKATLKEISRILKPGGVLAVTTPNIGSLAARLLWKRWEEVKRVREHIYFFSGFTLARLLEDLNFKILKKESAGRYFSIEAAIERGKIHNKPVFSAIGGILNFLNLSKKMIYIDPRYKVTIYAQKAAD